MANIVEAIYSMIGDMLELPKDEDTPEKRVAKIFSNMDLVRFQISLFHFNCFSFVLLTISMYIS